MVVSRTIAVSYFSFAILISACAGRTHSNNLAEPAISSDVVTLEVENHNWADVNLFIIHDGVETRFAQVSAAHDVSLEIPEKLRGQMGVIRLEARRIGGTDSFLSQAISLRGNSAVRFTIESSLARSSVGVW
jgi:hypothetical protein